MQVNVRRSAIKAQRVQAQAWVGGDQRAAQSSSQMVEIVGHVSAQLAAQSSSQTVENVEHALDQR